MSTKFLSRTKSRVSDRNIFSRVPQIEGNTLRFLRSIRPNLTSVATQLETAWMELRVYRKQVVANILGELLLGKNKDLVLLKLSSQLN